MDISGKCTVYAKEREVNGRNMVFYTAGISKKDGDKWVKFYMPISFKKDVVLADKTRIEIRQGWLDFYKSNKDDSQVVKIFANEFDIMELPAEQPPSSNGFEVVEDEGNLPF